MGAALTSQTIIWLTLQSALASIPNNTELKLAVRGNSYIVAQWHQPKLGRSEM